MSLPPVTNRPQAADKIPVTISGGLYQKEAKIYPKGVRGRFDRLRKLAMAILLGLFYGVVWLSFDNRQAVLFDLPARKFYIWGLTLWPQDFIYLAVLLLLLALTLFFFTALAGRLWCGYACPQTVWTEAFLLIESWVEGDRNRRMKLDQGPKNIQFLGRKALKQLLWISLSLWTGLTFVGYFMPVRELIQGIVQLDLHPWAWFWFLFYALATYGNAGFLREQVCKYMCPYARFQSAMFDNDTLIIAYDEQRGEPRGGRRRGDDPLAMGLGACIDCTLCVQVCPTGIDIRQGLQYECIACAACIDACDEVMDKMSYPRGLIRYTSANAVKGGKARVLRPRMMVYAVLLLVISTGLATSIGTRTPLRMEVIRDRNALYRELADGQIENVYTLRVINMTEQDAQYELAVSGVDAISFDSPALKVSANQAAAFPLRVRSKADDQFGSVAINLTLTDLDDPQIQVQRQSKFFLPAKSP